MTPKLNRREFVASAAAVALGAALPEPALGAPAVLRRRARPAVVSSANGNRYRNGGDETCVERVFRLMTGGEDVMDSIIAGVELNELDPGDTSVGYGGLPNGDGVVQLDASAMHGPLKRAGAVAALEGVRTPAKVARHVLHDTDHHLLVGEGAQIFARQLGFTIEEDLNSEVSRSRWLEWKRRLDPDRWLDPATRVEAAHEAGLSMVRDGLIDPDHYYGTINCNAVNAAGDLAGVTTTSGLAWKIPGRVGDSPILGAGLYVDNGYGAAGSTGRGEANLYGLCSFVVVEEMRRGRHPVDAGLEACRRIVENTIEPRLLDENGRPNFNINFYVVNKAGEYAGVAMYPNRYAVCTENGAETLDSVPFFESM